MNTRSSLDDPNIPRVYYMGSVNIHIIAGGRKPPQLAIENTRFERSADDKFWSIINDLTPFEYKRLNRLIADAIAEFKKPGEPKRRQRKRK
ncbi:MAG: hypothetical protein DCC65_02450 [Planctomycetota bacterium]|nr:MAG: hypothetical protein DCC65_02450 [Planctomycetota bacterium]